MTQSFKAGPLSEPRFAKLLDEIIEQSDDSVFETVDFDTRNLYYLVPWLKRYVVVDRISKFVKYDAEVWGFKSIESARAFVRSCNVNIFSSLDPGEDESSRTGVDFCDLC